MGMLPYANDEFDKASEYLRLAVALLAKHRIPPSPMHFRLGYESVAGRGDELKAELDQLLARPGETSSEELWGLYQRYFEQDSEQALEKIRHELRHIIVNIMGEFERSGGHLSRYAQTLNRFASILDKGAPVQEMADQVQNVIAETRSMEGGQRQLESNMSSIMSEVELLRGELEQVKKESLMDALTGISNRKAFDAALENIVYAARQRTMPFCLLLIDIDYFKTFNDTYGHLVGDKVLRFVASTLKRCVKGNDTVARFGGEEFAIVLPNTSLIGAEAVSEQIRRAISESPLLDKDSGRQLGKITVSIGVSQFRRDELPNELVERVDQALYTAKRQGRNRVQNAA